MTKEQFNKAKNIIYAIRDVESQIEIWKNATDVSYMRVSGQNFSGEIDRRLFDFGKARELTIKSLEAKLEQLNTQFNEL